MLARRVNATRRLGALATTFVLGAALLTGLSASSGADPATPAVTVSPDNGLTNGQHMEVSGSGFAATANVQLELCSDQVIQSGPFQGDAPCDPSAALPAGDTDGGGAFGPTDFVVYDQFIAQDGEAIDCHSAPSCKVVAFVGFGAEAAEMAIGFAAPPPPVPTVNVTPSTGLVDHQYVAVSGTGFAPFANVQLELCSDQVITSGPFTGQAPCDPSAAAPAGNTDPSGSFAVPFGVPFAVYTHFMAQDGSSIDCTMAPFCKVVALVGFGSQSAERPIAFLVAAGAITVTPSTGLTNGQHVDVSGSGFAPNANVQLELCSNQLIPFGPYAGHAPCDPSAALPAGDTDGSGSFGPSDFVVYDHFTAQDGESINCFATPFCTVTAFVGNSQFAATAIAVVPPASLLLGHVTDGDGTPVSAGFGAFVAACPGGSVSPTTATPCPGQLTTALGLDGSYALALDPGVRYRVAAFKFGGGTRTSVQSLRARLGTMTRDFSFDARIVGVVRDTNGVAVPAAYVDAGGVAPTFTGPSGEYASPWLGHGPIVLTVQPPGIGLAEYAAKLTLLSGTTTLDVVLEPEALVQGVVRNGDGSPASAQIVACRGSATFLPTPPVFGCSNGLPAIFGFAFSGNYVLHGLSERSYTIQAVGLVPGSPVAGVTLSPTTSFTKIVNCTMNGPTAGCVLGVPEVPSDVVATPSATDAGKVSLSFTAPADSGLPITEYRLACAGPTTKAVTRPAGGPFLVGGLVPGGTYTCTAQARNAMGLGPVSDPSAPVTLADVPSAPTDASASPAGAKKLSIAFTPGSDNGSAITSYRLTCTGPNTKTATVPVGGPYLVTGLTSGSSYTCTVQARNAIGFGPNSAPSAATLLT